MVVNGRSGAQQAHLGAGMTDDVGRGEARRVETQLAGIDKPDGNPHQARPDALRHPVRVADVALLVGESRGGEDVAIHGIR